MSRSVILILFLFCGCADSNIINEGTLSVSPGACLPNASDTYIYPVQPGSEEWQAAEDMETLFGLVQLPDNVLKSISTLGLIDALVKAPLFSGFFLSSSSSPVDTWNRHYDRFNSARELFRRKDGGNALVTYYKSVCFDCFEDADDDFRPVNMLETISGLEFLFTRQEILDKIEHRQKQELVADFLLKMERMSDIYTNLIPVAFVMFDDGYAPIVEYYRNNTGLYKKSIAQGYVFSEEQADLIISFAESYIEK